MQVLIIASILISFTIAQQQQQQKQQQQQQQQQLFIPPPFLEGASKAVITEFKQLLIGAEQRTDEEMEKIIELWISRQNEKIQMAFQLFKEKAIMALQEIEKQRKAIVSRLSPSAREADRKLTAVATNRKMTALQKQLQIDAIIAQIPQNVKTELQQAFIAAS